jgi:hypothetical protein
VPVLSQTCPKLGAKDPAKNCLNTVPSSGLPAKGKWHQTNVARDHVQVIGISLIYNNDGIYRDLANQILSAGGVQPAQRTAIDTEDQFELNEIYGQVPFANEGPSGLVIGLATAGGLGAIGAGVAMMKFVKARGEKQASANTATVPQSFVMDERAQAVIKDEANINPALDL